MRVLISGAGGFIGTEIGRLLRARGDEVGALSRSGGSGELDVRWDAGTSIDAEAIAAGRFDAVVHLAGEPLDGRWTSTKREEIVRSREQGTALLARTLAQLEGEARPATLVTASAVGYYGDRGNELLTEESGRGEGFLAELVERWEAAAEPAREAGLRVAHMRTGLVLGRGSGALDKLLLPFRLGLGGKVSTGSQYWAWVALGEVARGYLAALDEPSLTGPVNLVGPTPATNQEFTRALGRALGRPTVMRVPAFALRLGLGRDQADELLLASQKVVPMRLEGIGYEFRDRTVDQALRRELERDED